MELVSRLCVSCFIYYVDFISRPPSPMHRAVYSISRNTFANKIKTVKTVQIIWQFQMVLDRQFMSLSVGGGEMEEARRDESLLLPSTVGWWNISALRVLRSCVRSCRAGMPGPKRGQAMGEGRALVPPRGLGCSSLKPRVLSLAHLGERTTE